MRIYLVRHAHAGSRSDWEGDDRLRPLSPKGRKRADELPEVLGQQGIERLASSHYLRCTQTLAPLADRLGLEVEDSPALAEGASLAQGIELIESLVADGRTAALCSHGDVIPELLAGLARRGTHLDPDGACPKGSVWVLTVADGVVTHGIYAGTGALPVG
ncbi:MAG: SixA phosphatase family protein [Acidimicrobiales bacterium]